MKKILVLIAFIFLITGCKVDYHVVINEDLSLTEEANLTGTQDFFDNYYKTTKTHVLESFIDIYKDVLETNNYQYELVKDTTPYVKVNKTYDSVSDYTKNSILFNDYFDEVKYTEDGNIKRIETVGFNEDEPDNPNRFEIAELTISIKCPFKVKNHNAKEVDKRTNTYYYELNEDNKILLEYDISSKFNPQEELIKTLIICIIVVVAIWLAIIILNKKSKK